MGLRLGHFSWKLWAPFNPISVPGILMFALLFGAVIMTNES